VHTVVKGYTRHIADFDFTSSDLTAYKVMYNVEKLATCKFTTVLTVDMLVF